MPPVRSTLTSSLFDDEILDPALWQHVHLAQPVSEIFPELSLAVRRNALRKRQNAWLKIPPSHRRMDISISLTLFQCKKRLTWACSGDQGVCMTRKSFASLFFLWLAWVFILLGFQAWTVMRFQIKHPDYALEWTPIDTALTYKHDKPYLNEPFMNQQVAFDSEYYLSIATVGYADPEVTAGDIHGERIPLNYAFMPFYPYVMKAVALPLRALHLTPIATSTLAGVIVSVLGTLAGMLALYDLAREELGEDGGLRAAFYLLIFPAGFFLAMVYTEGLFVGLAFGALALIKRKQWIWAILLAVLATWTRAVGVALVIPLVIAFTVQISGGRSVCPGRG